MGTGAEPGDEDVEVVPVAVDEGVGDVDFAVISANLVHPFYRDIYLTDGDSINRLYASVYPYPIFALPPAFLSRFTAFCFCVRHLSIPP